MISQSYSMRISTQSTNSSPLLFLDHTSRTIFLLLEVFRKPKLFLRRQRILYLGRHHAAPPTLTTKTTLVELAALPSQLT